MRVRTFSRACATAMTATLVLLPQPLLASGGHFEDKLADILVWVVLVLAPVIGIGAFLAVHILPEKVAENRAHPQLDAIKTVCLLSLVFGGILWPLAWVWAYAKPVMYKIAYGKDRVELHGPGASHARDIDADEADHAELLRLRRQLAELEATARSGRLA